MRKAGAGPLGMIFGLPVLLASVLMGVIPAGAASKGQCVRTVCTPGKRSCIGDFTTQFKQAKATCAAGKAGAQCRKGAKATFRRTKGLCKTAFAGCKTCCGGSDQSSCSASVTTTTTTLAPSTTSSTTTTTTTTTTTMTPTPGATINTITGTFTGHDDDEGSVLDWSGTATFKRVDGLTGIHGSFVLASGEATVTASGTALGTGCQQTGTQHVAVSPASVWAVEGEAEPYTYQIVAGFDYPGTVDVTWVNCSDPSLNGTPSTISIGPPAIQSFTVGGSNLNQTSPDGFVYDGSFNVVGGAGLEPGEMASWTWSMRGSP